MTGNTPQDAVEILDAAFNRGDLETVLDFYEPSAVVVMEPGKLARGAGEIRDFFQSAMRAGATAKQLKTNVIEADGVALLLSRWTLTLPEGAPRTFVATTVLRQQADGSWKALIDNSIGPVVLGD